MHHAQVEFRTTVTNAFPEKFAGKVLDVGSEDINGNLVEVFAPLLYVGVDLAAGKNVTMISRGENVDCKTGSFDAVFSGECFEHNLNYLSTFFNMIRMTKPGGIIAFTCASRFRMEHGTTKSDGGAGAPSSVSTGNEYYKNLTQKHFKHAVREGHFLAFGFYRNFAEQDLYFVGIKKSDSDVDSLLKRFISLDNEIKKFVRKMNKPRRVATVNLDLLKMAITRSLINFLYRNFSRDTLNVLKSWTKKGVIENSSQGKLRFPISDMCLRIYL